MPLYGPSNSQHANSRKIYVGIELGDAIVSAGMLLVQPSMTSQGDRSVGRFRYAPSYLVRPDAVALDPVHLALNNGVYQFARHGGLPSCIRDSMPDAWGRRLIDRYFRSHGIAQKPSEVDYLLASPEDRVGTLHFAATTTPGPGGSSRPAWDTLSLKPSTFRDLAILQRSLVEVLSTAVHPLGMKFPDELRALLTGAGGARPKVTVRSPTHTTLAKLPNPLDDVAPNGRLELASITMARAVGIPTAELNLHTAGDFDVLGVKRFDIVDGRRWQMISALSVLDADDQGYGRNNWSYPLFARELDRWSADPVTDKATLYRCMLLRALISDCDDHPRNYALLRDPDQPVRNGNTLGQWRLAPMFDSVVGLGTGQRASHLAMTIGDRSTEISRRNFLSQAHAFGFSVHQALAEIERIEHQVLTEFDSVMQRCGIDGDTRIQAMGAVAPLDRPREPTLADLAERAAEEQAGHIVSHDIGHETFRIT